MVGLGLTEGMGIPNIETGLPLSSGLGCELDAPISIHFLFPTVESVRLNDLNITIMANMATTTTKIVMVLTGGTKVTTIFKSRVSRGMIFRSDLSKGNRGLVFKFNKTFHRVVLKGAFSN